MRLFLVPSPLNNGTQIGLFRVSVFVDTPMLFGVSQIWTERRPSASSFIKSDLRGGDRGQGVSRVTRHALESENYRLK